MERIKIKTDRTSIINIVNELKTYTEKILNYPGLKYSFYFYGKNKEISVSEFENKSNELEIAVISNHKNIAYMLLYFVRMIVDKYPEGIQDILFDYENEELSLKELVDILGNILTKCYKDEYENEYINAFGLNANLTRKHPNKTFVTKKIDDVDIWTTKRVFNELFALI